MSVMWFRSMLMIAVWWFERKKILAGKRWLLWTALLSIPLVYYAGNEKSKRVQEKVGFRYQWTTENVDVPLLHEIRTEHVNSMTKKEWLKRNV